MCTHTPTIGGNCAGDSAGKSELVICSPQDQIVYPSCRISGCNFQHYDHEASEDLVAVTTVKIRFRLWYRPTSWFWLPPPATCLTTPTSHLPPSGSWRLQLSKSLDHAPRSIHRSISSSEIGSVLPLDIVLGTVLRSVLESVLRAYLGAYSQAGWKCAIECRWECIWARARECGWERLENLRGSV